MDYKAIAEWALSGTAGASATCIAHTMMGMKTRGDYPHDGGDFGRCERLLDAVPEFRERFPEMAEVNRYWALLVPRWDEIKASSDQYALIQSIIRPTEDTDRSIVRGGGGASLRFGNIS